MSRKYTHEEFVSEVSKKHSHIKVIGRYKGKRSKIKLHCDIHDYDFEINADSVLKSVHGCKYCAIDYVSNCVKKTNEKFLEKVSNNLNDNVVILGDYTGSHPKIKCKCKNCGNIWYAFPDALYHGNGCKKCAMKYVQNYRIKSHEQFLREFKERNVNYRVIEILSTYVKDDKPIMCKCKVCGHVWSPNAHSLIEKRSPSGCPLCNTSKGERKIINYLEDNNVRFEWQKSYVDLVGLGGGLLSYDFYIPERNLLIEYQGEFHDGSVPHQSSAQLKYQKGHDKRKRKYAESHSIELLEIWYSDFNNIEQILKEILAA